MTRTPQLPTPRPEAVFMIGGPGAGKSYIRSREYPTHVVVDCDQFKEAHPDYDPENPSALHVWSRQECTKLFHRTLGGYASFVFDGTGADLDALHARMQMASAAGFKVVIHYVRCPLPVALKRNRERPRVVPEDVVRTKHSLVDRSFRAARVEAEAVRTTENWSEAELIAAQSV